MRPQTGHPSTVLVLVAGQGAILFVVTLVLLFIVTFEKQGSTSVLGEKSEADLWYGYWLVDN